MDQSQNMTKEHTFYYAALMRDPEKTTDSDKPWLSEGDRLIYVIRHAERDSDGSSTTDINSTGVTHAKSIGTQLAYGNAPSSSYANCTIPFEANDAHYFATELVRTQHTAQCIAEGRGDTDSSASDYSGITIDQELLEGYRYLKSRPASGTTELLKKYANQPENLTQDELTTYFGVSSADEARNQIVSDTRQFINEIINAADKFGKRLNFFITSDYYIGCMQAGVTGLQYNQTGNNPWVNWCSGVAIVVHPDNTYDTFAVKCSKK
jgi:broad specificity phosphatase PhoE